MMVSKRAAALLLVCWAVFVSANPVEVEDDEELDQIIGGTTVQKGEQQYMVYLLMYSSAGINMCGGTIINRKTIMTAAHCVDKGPYTKIDAYLRTWTVNPMDASAIRVNVLNEYLRIHPGYKTSAPLHDIALIRLPTALNFYDYYMNPTTGDYYWIDQIYRPSTNFTYEGYTALAFGWGLTSSTSTTPSSTMQGVSLQVLSKAECTNRWALYGYSHESQLCAHSPNKSACRGDSGGPLVVNGVQLGITSYGHPTYPCEVLGGVFVRVSYYKNWIEANMAY